jgi:hypothetical protein
MGGSGCTTANHWARSPAFEVTVSPNIVLDGKQGPALPLTFTNRTPKAIDIRIPMNDLEVLSAGRWVRTPDRIVVTGSSYNERATLTPGASETESCLLTSCFIKVVPGPNQVKFRATILLLRGNPFSAEVEQSFDLTPAMARTINRSADKRYGVVAHR